MRVYNLSFADWTFSEYAEILSCIFRGQVISGDNPGRLGRALSRLYPESTVYPMNYGRSAIGIALRAFSRKSPARMEVVVPAYVCPSVMETVTASGLIPVAADVGDDLNFDVADLAARLNGNTLAVIVPHMYGCPAKIREIEDLCRSAGVFLIDDAAQVVGVLHQGKMLGAFGDFGIISFAQSKAVVTGIQGSGGALLVNNSEFDAEVRMEWENMPLSSGRLGIFLYFLWSCIFGRLTGNSGYYLGRIGEMLGFRLLSSSGSSHISNLEAGIAIVQLKRLKTIMENRVKTVEAYHCALKNHENIGFPQYAPGRYLSRIMLALPTTVDIAAVRAILKKNGIGTRVGYLAQVLPPERHAGTAEEWSRRLLGVPCGTNIGQFEAQEICRMVNMAIDYLT